jgi:hypothetical protein
VNLLEVILDGGGVDVGGGFLTLRGWHVRLKEAAGWAFWQRGTSQSGKGKLAQAKISLRIDKGAAN